MAGLLDANGGQSGVAVEVRRMAHTALGRASSAQCIIQPTYCVPPMYNPTYILRPPPSPTTITTTITTTPRIDSAVTTSAAFRASRDRS